MPARIATPGKPHAAWVCSAASVHALPMELVVDTGTLDGRLCRIAVPDHWNGARVLNAHGDDEFGSA